jgi:hypothetical protein
MPFAIPDETNGDFQCFTNCGLVEDLASGGITAISGDAFVDQGPISGEHGMDTEAALGFSDCFERRVVVRIDNCYGTVGCPAGCRE